MFSPSPYAARRYLSVAFLFIHLFLSLLSDKGYKENRPETVMTLFNLPAKNHFQKSLNIKRVSGAEGLSHFQGIIEESCSLPEGSGPYCYGANSKTDR
jgi:hypothetical protein